MVASPHTTTLLHTIWQRIQSPFVVPTKICQHTDWEIYDIDRAGCLQCGQLHTCEVNTCNTEPNDEGHLFCKTTGCCVRTVSYSEHEFVDTVVMTAEKPRANGVNIMNHRSPFGRMNKKNRYRSWVNCRLNSSTVNSNRTHTTTPVEKSTRMLSNELKYIKQYNVIHPKP
jgi:hypothetical protein